MRNIILAILAVFCLQLTFQVYSAIDRSNDEYVAMRATDPVSGLPVMETEAADIPEGESAPIWWFNTRDRDRERLVRHASSQTRSQPTLVAATRTDRRTRSVTVKDTLLKPMPVRATSSEAMTFSAHYREPVRKDKKPLIVKIIKKPYDWLKAVGGLFH